MMDTFYQEIQRIGRAAKSMTLAYNLLLWTAYSRYYSLESRTLNSMEGNQRFQMAGSTAHVFDLSHQAARVLGPLGYLNFEFTIRYHVLFLYVA